MKKISIAGLNDRKKSRRQMTYQGGNQRDGSPYYVLLYSDDEHSEDEENILLQNLSHSNSFPRKVEVIKIQLQPEDTLQSLALKYRCTVSELKRINHIHKDNEIFAHRSLKVPVVSHSILTETLNEIEDEGTSNSSYNTEMISTSKEEQILKLIATPIVICPHKSTNDISESIKDEETIQWLNSSDQEISSKTNLIDFCSCSGADWGLSWRKILTVFFLLIIGVPIFLFFIADAPHHTVSVH